MAEAVQTVGWSEEEIGGMQSRLGVAMTCYPESPEDRWVIEWVATAPEFRGRGIVQQLLLAILEKGREQGFQKAQVAYLLGNEPARRSYERVGFETVSERRDPDFEAALQARPSSVVLRAPRAASGKFLKGICTRLFGFPNLI